MTRFQPASFCLALAAMLAGCKPPARGVTYAGGDGSSVEQAVVIQATNEMQGTTAEYVWLADHYPGCHSGNQSLLAQNGNSYDRLDIVTKDGRNRSVYFDITAFLGK